MRIKYCITLFALIGMCLHGWSQSMEDLLSGEIDAIVDATGSGDYTTVSAAVSAAPNNGSSEHVIFIRNGIYTEKVEISSGKTHLTLVGESIDGVKITWDDYSGKEVGGVTIGTSTSHTLISDANDFKIINLTIENTAGTIAQAVALNFHGDRQSLLHARLIGGQDTFYTWGAGRFYVYDSYIEGGTDFIFGRGAMYVENSLIVTNKDGSPVTAASTDEGWGFGYVFDNCTFDAVTGVGNVPLGRPWKPFCQVVIMNSFLDEHVRQAQWSTWSGNTNHETAYYGLYNNEGPGYSPDTRLDWTHVLTDEEAATYTMENIFAANVSSSPFSSNWNPNLANDAVFSTVSDNTEDILSDTLFYIPAVKTITYGDNPMDDYDESRARFYYNLPANRLIEVDLINVELEDPAATFELVETVDDKFPIAVYVDVTTRNGFTKRFTILFDQLPLGVEEGLAAEVSVFPNPSMDHINFSGEGIEAGLKYKVGIYSLAGELVFEKEIQAMSNGLSIDSRSIGTGMFLYEITGPEFIATGKIFR